MWYRISQIILSFDSKMDELESLLLKKLSLKKEDLLQWKIQRRSLDARKGELRYVYSLLLETRNTWKPRGKNPNLQVYEEKPYTVPFIHTSKKEDHTRPIVIGSGPAGLFCALILAEQGMQPLLLERGDAVETRAKKVAEFWEKGLLDTQSNMQFGEGGAGTFSDGKLNTGIKDSAGRMQKVLDSFVEAGAPSEILISNKPHIGTDYLEIAVKNLRKKIEALGGEVRFRAQVTNLKIENQKILGVEVNGQENIEASQVVLAIGHSARDSFEMLQSQKIPMEKKIFAVGLRIEHSQSLINRVQYGQKYANRTDLPAADYKLAYKTAEGRGVYTFCMCPGGYVVQAASEEGMCVTNGMSYYSRASRNANAAVLVNVYPEDFPSSDVLAGVSYQRDLEKKAFQLGGGDYSLPIQRLEDFRLGRVSQAFGLIEPETKGVTAFADLNLLWDQTISQSLVEGLQSFERKISGFAQGDALLSGVESRSSSPVRILRNEQYQSSIQGLFPCGEGAGYAGGIMSAAVDGIKVAEAVLKN